MPRVVIELQANTQDAVNKIQQFARAQKDAFDAIKAGNPALQDASVKVSKLTESTKLSTQAAYEFNSAAKNLAAGGVRDLIGQVPILGSAIANLAGNLKGLPLLLVAAGSAAFGVVKYLKDLEAQTLKTADAIKTLSDRSQDDFLSMTQRVKAMQATAAGRPEIAGAIEFGEIEKRAGRTQEAEYAAAQKARNEAIGLVDQLQGYLNPQALRDKQTIADAAYQQARADADTKASRTITEAREKFKLDLVKIEDDLTKQHADAQAKRTEDAAAAAEKQKQLVEALTAASLATFKGLGAGFEDVVKSLELAQFVTQTTEKIAELNAGIAAGIDTHGRFAEGVQALQTKMQEAIALGYVPTTEAAKSATGAIEASGRAAVAAGANFQQMASDAMQAAQALSALAAAQRASPAGGPSPSFGLTPGMSQEQARVTGEQSLYDLDRLNKASLTLQEAQNTLNSYDSARRLSGRDWDPPSFQFGGVVPGTGPVAIIAHGGETIVPAGGARGGSGRMVRIEAGAVQVSGTVIDQQRGWEVLVEELGQALEARLR